MKKKLLAKYERMLKDPPINSWMAGYKTSSRYNYLGGLERFMKYVKMTPAQLIARRKADLKKTDEYERRRFERQLLEFNRESLKEGKPGATMTAIKAVRSFFTHHYVKLEFQFQQKRELSKSAKPVYVDYLPTREDLKAMVEVADVRDRGVLLTLASTGIGGDVAEFTRAQFEEGKRRGEPVCMAPHGDYLHRAKTGVRMRPFLTRDAVQTINVYLKTRKDGAPWLFVDASGNKLSTDALNKIVVRLTDKAGLNIPEGQRMRLHNFRDFFSEAAHDADIPHDWICVLYGREVSGSEDFYVHATEDKVREKFKRAEPQLSVSRITNMVILRNQFNAALDEQTKQQYLSLLQLVGKERFAEMARYHLSMRPMIKWDPEKEIEPAIYRTQRILREILGKLAPRKRKRGA